MGRSKAGFKALQNNTLNDAVLKSARRPHSRYGKKTRSLARGAVATITYAAEVAVTEYFNLAELNNVATHVIKFGVTYNQAAVAAASTVSELYAGVWELWNRRQDHRLLDTDPSTLIADASTSPPSIARGGRHGHDSDSDEGATIEDGEHIGGDTLDASFAATADDVDGSAAATAASTATDRDAYGRIPQQRYFDGLIPKTLRSAATVAASVAGSTYVGAACTAAGGPIAGLAGRAACTLLAPPIVEGAAWISESIAIGVGCIQHPDDEVVAALPAPRGPGAV